MASTTSINNEVPAFRLEIKTSVHLHGGDPKAFTIARTGIAASDGVSAQLERRIVQAGGRFRFDLDDLQSDLREAAYFYFGAATYSFDSNPGYRYSTIRIAARKTLRNLGLAPLSTELRHEGFRVETQLNLDEIELGSLKFLQTVSVVLAIAANAPRAYDNLQQIYLPQARIVKSQIENYVEEYFNTLRKAGVDVEHRTPPIRIPDQPQLPQPSERERRRPGRT